LNEQEEASNQEEEEEYNADANVFLVIRRESLQLDIEHVGSGGQQRKAQSPPVVRGSPAHQSALLT
jgi:hypothetical protein